ncbi:hypothetical protein B0G75_13921 [Paraburkholderia sp. BL18I3N2]|nr:hypothetical protein B0G75_13921 [Paraburkholderia sp. BL18I3N2]
MRVDQVQSSTEFKGLADANDPEASGVISNESGPSAGINGDEFKLAGTRVSMDDLLKYGTVSESPDGSWLFNATTTNPDTGKLYTLAEALNKTGGLTGGFQGLPGTIAGLPYVAGGFTDRLLESFAGPHDFLGSLTAYDRLGNLVEGMTSLQRAAFEFQTDIDIPLAAPIAAATVLGQYGLDWSVINGQKTKAEEGK